LTITIIVAIMNNNTIIVAMFYCKVEYKNEIEDIVNYLKYILMNLF